MLQFAFATVTACTQGFTFNRSGRWFRLFVLMKHKSQFTATFHIPTGILYDIFQSPRASRNICFNHHRIRFSVQVSGANFGSRRGVAREGADVQHAPYG